MSTTAPLLSSSEKLARDLRYLREWMLTLLVRDWSVSWQQKCWLASHSKASDQYWSVEQSRQDFGSARKSPRQQGQQTKIIGWWTGDSYEPR